MVALAVVGILATVSVPFYMGYTRDSANRACLLEAKIYAGDVIVRLNNSSSPLVASGGGACSSYSGANAGLTAAGSFTATAKSPGTALITCTLAGGARCSY